MKSLGIAITVSGVVSTAALVALVAADRQLGVPVPYALSCVVAILNAAGALAIALPRRAVVASRPLARVGAPVGATKAQPATASVDEAVVWFETAGRMATEEAA